MPQQIKSKDYKRLFDLVFNQGFEIPCCLNYSFIGSEHVFTDFASVRKQDESIQVGVRGMSYISCCDWMINEHFKSIEEMFIKDCERDNLEWFDTFANTME